MSENEDKKIKAEDNNDSIKKDCDGQPLSKRAVKKMRKREEWLKAKGERR